MPQTKARVVGSGFTSFNYAGKVLAYCTSVQDSGVQPVSSAGGVQAIHPLGARHPIEFVTPRAVTHGTLGLTLVELWNEPVWWQLQNLYGASDIVEVYQRLADDPNQVTCQMVIRPPGSNVVRGKLYHNCVVVSIPDDETITVGALAVPRNIQVAYTHTTALSATI